MMGMAINRELKYDHTVHQPRVEEREEDVKLSCLDSEVVSTLTCRTTSGFKSILDTQSDSESTQR